MLWVVVVAVAVVAGFMCVCVGVCGLLVLWPLVWSTEGHKGTEDWWVRVSWGGVVPWASINSGWKAMCPPLFP